jgi:hypothetical protein
MLIPLVPTDLQLAAPDGDHQPADAACESSSSGARVIEFYVPATFQLPERRWIPQEARGKLIQFPTRKVKKSA